MVPTCGRRRGDHRDSAASRVEPALASGLDRGLLEEVGEELLGLITVTKAGEAIGEAETGGVGALRELDRPAVVDDRGSVVAGVVAEPADLEDERMVLRVGGELGLHPMCASERSILACGCKDCVPPRGSWR